MRLKSALSASLLVFVAASVVVPVVRSVVRRYDARSKAISPSRPDALVVCYFRAKVRCPACRTLETCSKEVVEKHFASENVVGEIEWQAIDYQSPGNEHFMTDFNLLTGGVVLVKFQDGHPWRWRALTETWNMTGDCVGLARYLEDAILEFRKEGA